MILFSTGMNCWMVYSWSISYIKSVGGGGMTGEDVTKNRNIFYVGDDGNVDGKGNYAHFDWMDTLKRSNVNMDCPSSLVLYLSCQEIC